ncbi:MAG: hypothetical protein QM755_15855 [Luteolibacter sp.]
MSMPLVRRYHVARIMLFGASALFAIAQFLQFQTLADQTAVSTYRLWRELYQDVALHFSTEPGIMHPSLTLPLTALLAATFVMIAPWLSRLFARFDFPRWSCAIAMTCVSWLHVWKVLRVMDLPGTTIGPGCWLIGIALWLNTFGTFLIPPLDIGVRAIE